jgi:hypothetical protein
MWFGFWNPNHLIKKNPEKLWRWISDQQNISIDKIGNESLNKKLFKTKQIAIKRIWIKFYKKIK